MSGHLSIGGVRVSVYSDGAEVLIAETWADATGEFVLVGSQVPPGPYRVRFADDQWHPSASSWADAATVVVDADGTTLDATLAPVGAGTISGTVTAEPSGSVAEGATVTAVNAATGADIAGTTTDVAGAYSLDLPTGSYKLRFAEVGQATAYSGNVSALAAATAVSVTTGSSTSGVDVVLPTLGTMTGTVRLASPIGPLVAGVRVLVFHSTVDHLFDETTTAADGSFAVPNLSWGAGPSGEFYRVLTIPPDPDWQTAVTWAAPSSTPPVALYGRDCPDGRYVDSGPDQRDRKLMGCALASDIDYRGADLRYASGRHAVSTSNLGGADLRYSTLSAWWTNVDVDGADLSGARTWRVETGSWGEQTLYVWAGYGITGTPAAMPTDWRLAGGVLFGPATTIIGQAVTGADLAGVKLPFAKITDVDLTGSDLSGGDLRSATLVDVVLEDVDLSGADLAGVSSSGLIGTPTALPAGWSIVGGVLVGP